MASEAAPKRGRKSAKNHVRSAKPTKSGYVVESFEEETTGGYGNLKAEAFSPLQAIRRFCWGCQGGHEFDWADTDGKVVKRWRPYQEVRDCTAKTCFLYPYRTGRGSRRKPAEDGPKLKKRPPRVSSPSEQLNLAE